jgi:hypothetical protein
MAESYDDTFRNRLAQINNMGTAQNTYAMQQSNTDQQNVIAQQNTAFAQKQAAAQQQWQTAQQAALLKAQTAQQAKAPVAKVTTPSLQQYAGAKLGDSTAHARLLALGKYLQTQGYQVGENSAFGNGKVGVHSKNSNHYSGNAIDVNWGNSAQEKGKINSILGLIKQYQLGDIWQAPGHYDHIHISTNGR